MIDEVRALMDQYLAWLREKTSLREINGVVEITTPYLDRHNDHLQFYVKKNKSGYILTDDGYIIKDLELSGCVLDSPKRQDLLHTTLNGFGVQNDQGALVVHAMPENFNLRKHNLVQAMLAVNDLFYLAAPIVESLFLEDVASWLDINDVRYTPNVKFTGKSGYDHSFHFIIPKSRRAPERFVQAINNPVKVNAQRTAFAYIDTKEARPANSQAFAFLNDAETTPAASVLDALRSYDVEPVLWRNRDEVKEKLAA